MVNPLYSELVYSSLRMMVEVWWVKPEVVAVRPDGPNLEEIIQIVLDMVDMRKELELVMRSLHSTPRSESYVTEVYTCTCTLYFCTCMYICT